MDYTKGLYNQLEDTINRLEALSLKMDQMEKKHDEEIAELKEEHKKEIAELKEEHKKEIAELKEEHKKEIAAKDAIIKEQAARIQVLEEKNEKLTEEVSRLKSILNNDSNNSSNPPSSDQKPSKKANEYNSRVKSGKHKGAQKGHKGKTLTEEDAKELLKAPGCKHVIEHYGKKSDKYTVRYEIDINVEPVVIEKRYYEGAHNVGMTSSVVTYGNKLKSMVIALYGIGVVANDRIASFINNITNKLINVATGTVYGFCRNFSLKAQQTLENIETQLLNSNVVSTDATVVSTDGVQSYIRNASTEKIVKYYALEDKKIESLKQIPFFEKFIGTFIHDHETCMYHFGTKHGECNVHLMRYLTKNSENTCNSWSNDMIEFLKNSNDQRKILIGNGQYQFSKDDIEIFAKKYDEILENAVTQCAQTKPKWARKEEKALINRLIKYKAEQLLFIYDFDVPFHNNLSERDLRKCKSRQKISGGFRNQSGVEIFCNILSIIESAKRQSLNPFDVIIDIFNGETYFSQNVSALTAE